MNFDWHRLKAETNAEKHGVTFEEAQTAFLDEGAYHFKDRPHSIGEQRFICLGMSMENRLLMVVYTENEPDNIWIISAREATKREEVVYARQDHGT
ncbi:MAG: BrnT family toxin [Blastocatellia bacterium]|nr:BrnT family toxin [Blastocatellia bacterium]